MKRLSQLSLAVAVICLLVSVPAEAAKWRKLGAKTLVYKSNQDVIKVKNADLDCSQIKLKVSGKWLQVEGLKVFFTDGSNQDIEIREAIEPGLESSVIDIDGGPRAIEKVELVYSPTDGRNSGRSIITLMGMS